LFSKIIPVETEDPPVISAVRPGHEFDGNDVEAFV
jgi:hypothetical protein